MRGFSRRSVARAQRCVTKVICSRGAIGRAGCRMNGHQGLRKIRQAVCERRLGLAHRPCDGFIAGEDGHRHGGHGAQTVRVTQQLQGQMRGGAIGIASQGMSCFASSRLPRLAPDGLPSLPRSARLTPTARLPASGLPASLACGLRIAAVVAMSSRPPRLHHLARGCSPRPRAPDRRGR